jgi:Methyltransferase domain
MGPCSSSAEGPSRTELGSTTSFADRPWLAGSFRYPEQIPTMISREERQYLWWLAATVWRDAGHIVEMGPWLGGSTACLAEGIRARAAAPTHRLFSVDNFVWRRFMSDRADLALEPGESFEEEFRKNIAPYGSLVAPQCAWLPDEVVPGDRWAEDVRGDGTRGDLFRWQDGPVEIAFVDGAKSWTGLTHFLAELAPSLTANSLLVFQDYKYWGSYWVPMMCELLIEATELVQILPENTVTFRLTAPVAIERIGPLPNVDTGVGLLEQAAWRLDDHGDPLGATIVRLSAVRFLAHSGEIDASVRSLRHVSRGRGAALASAQILAVRDWLESFTGRSISVRVPRPGRTRARLGSFIGRTGGRVRAQSHRIPMTSR